KGKKILLGVCGSIAAYKSAYLVRMLVKEGAEVKVLMTDAACDFIDPLTFSTLSKNPVLTSFSTDEKSWNSHVELGTWADVFVIAPASANTLAKFASGLCDNLLTATYLSAKCPVVIAPAMDIDMWKHPATQYNLNALRRFGNEIIQVNYGELASGLVGEGRMAEPEEIAAHLKKKFELQKKRADFYKKIAGKRVLITAGPTIESIDPVRYISNHSTGKMGFAIAEELASLNAEVTLVKGPTSYNPEVKGITIIPVTSAQEMYEASVKAFPKADVAIMAAAVADYRPVAAARQKLKKDGESLQISLVRNPDILESLGMKKSKKQILVGFALETEDEMVNAKQKLQKKNLDMIVLNSLRDKGAGFGYDTNKITILNKKGEEKSYTLKSKPDVARDIIDEVINLMDAS
ncbi:MAG TPA: bifunctional phosphopantothenoylcysteine decarboxylase/phosphopantothenate--cysteine ligase CoaBC, partial [Chitinophagales bacterium]|nr:bifunctional phosphopantothenoylcysteine decarboxylase/phosphopantothenate--cysteine ligase CoaBC [Chitinophagales bacterium]